MVQKVTHRNRARSWARTRVSLCGVEPRDGHGRAVVGGFGFRALNVGAVGHVTATAAAAAG